jgi:cation:H+ antiporter
MKTTVSSLLDSGLSLSSVISDLSLLTLIVTVAVCIFLLSYGADKMIDGIVSLALRTGLPTIVIGATVISIGTTMPEAFVSVVAAYMGNPGLALGNGVGSIIADTGLIFGLTCILATPKVNLFILNRTGWIQIGSAVLLVALSILAMLKAPPN